MKWVLLLLILLAVVIAFGLWRRARPMDQRRPDEHRADPARPGSIAAAEAGADEVAASPATEKPPLDGLAKDDPEHPREQWWKDGRP